MRSTARHGLSAVCLAGLIVLNSPGPAAADYLLQIGDVVELSVVGLPELRTSATVSHDGSASLPMMGEVKAAGRTIADLRADVRSTLSRKVVPRATGDSVAFSPDQINVVISDYRPVFVNGDVAEPGSQKYSLGLTVREAIAVAGGFGTSQHRGSMPDPAALLDVQAEYGVLLNELAREQVRLARLKLEFGEEEVDTPALVERLRREDGGRDAEVVDMEAVQYRNRQSRIALDREFLQNSRKSIERRLEILGERRTNAQRVLETDTADFDRISELFKKGSAVVGRVSESRRSVLFSATQLLETEAAMSLMERDRDTIDRDLAKLDEDRRATVISDLQDARLKVRNLETRLLAVSQKVAVLSKRPHFVPDAPSITVFRARGGLRERVQSGLDDELSPGDAVEVSLQVVPERSVSR